ncbi:MAG: OmpH family outer membrane protein [Muribaculaceae bacterium]|nr:OmpH family outer membrane protein [Muribaculaceae bacterium]
MKKLLLFAAASIVLAAAGCNNNEENAAKTGNDSTAAVKASAPSINIRYVDRDSIMSNYNLAKDYKELYIKALNKIENAQRAKAAEIQKFASQIEQKVKSNGYLSEQSYNADMQKLNKMQQNAQNYMTQLQSEAEKDMAQRNIELNDSVMNFIKDYNKKFNYDAILFRDAGVYFNEALDITEEVTKGLNERYNKVGKK